MAASMERNVKCLYAGDDDVLQHIVNLECMSLDGSSPKKQVKSVLKPFKSRTKKSVTYAESESEDSETEAYRPSEVLAEEGVIGREIFTFKTPKKSGQMAVKALEATPRPVSTPKAKTPTSKKPASTPVGKQSQTRNRKPTEATPYRLRRRNEPVDSSGDSSGSDEDDASSVASSSSSVSAQSATTSKKKATSDPKKVQVMAEEYFAANVGNDVTSDRTLSRLKNPRMDQEMLTEALKDVGNQYEQECRQLMEDHTSLFKRWMFQLCNGYNLLLYGLGSKRQLLDDFRQQYLKDFLHVVINGYFPSITIKNILNSITEDALGLHANCPNPIDEVEFLRKHFHNDSTDLYIIIHNIDGPLMRSEKVQNILSQLASIPGIHFLSSIDHLNAPLVWDHTKTSRFNWIWYDATTFQAYTEETSYENSLLVQQSGTLALSSLTHVMRSLTPNAKGIFKMLVDYQLEQRDNSSYLGMSFQDMYQKCREAFLVNSDLTLRAQLTEFRDHKLIRSRKGIDGVEHLYIPLDAGTLEEFLSQQEEN